ncbi:hypothetical protein BD413DRAFT_472818 [Trametes elegans]|nr:hypothetical protein BD413DRAFT_472818 [Trametes elegans]
MSSLFQNAYYLAINFNAIFYGVELVIYSLSVNELLAHRKTSTRTDKFYIAFSTVLLVLITVYMSTEAVFGQEMWIVHQDSPGGPVQFFVDNADVWYQTMGTASSVVLNLLTDALLIYRMYVVWPSYRVIVFPCFLYLATIGLGIIELYASGKPGADFFVGTAAQLGVAYYTTTIALNALATTVICARLSRALAAASRSRGVRAGAHRQRYYVGTLPIVVESALPYSAAGVAFLVAYGLQSDRTVLFGAFYGMFACISPQLIVLRVVSGRSWTRESVSAAEFETLGLGAAARQTDAEVATTARSLDDGDRKSALGSVLEVG